MLCMLSKPETWICYCFTLYYIITTAMILVGKSCVAKCPYLLGHLLHAHRHDFEVNQSRLHNRPLKWVACMTGIVYHFSLMQLRKAVSEPKSRLYHLSQLSISQGFKPFKPPFTATETVASKMFFGGVAYGKCLADSRLASLARWTPTEMP